MNPMPSAHAISQYATTTGNLTARMALHTHGTNPQDWFSWLRERLPRSGRVLEVGAGTGRLWTGADHLDHGLDLTLTDFSPAMCEQLRTVPGATVRQCDAADLPFTDAAFDTVIANHMLYHLDDPAAALREFARVLRPGGQLAVAVNGSGHLAELDALGPAIGRPDLSTSSTRNDVTAETAPAYLARCFGDVSAERYPCDLAVPTSEPVLAFLASRSDTPLTGEQSDAARSIVQERIDAEGSFFIRKHTVLLTATR